MKMGTDIHMVGEKKWKWRSIGNDWETFVIPSQFLIRNYRFFAHLADVRNGFGFAGSSTHDPVEPLTSKRGYPEDMSKLTQSWLSGPLTNYLGKILGYAGEHSGGYATLDELVNHDWDQEGLHYGIMTLEDFAEWDLVSEPKNYYNQVDGSNVKVVDGPDVKVVDGPRVKVVDGATHVKVEWGSPYLDREFVDRFLGFLQEEGRDHDIRVIFNFDS